MDTRPRPWLIRLLLGGCAILIGLAAFAICLAYGLTPADFFGSSRKLSLWLGLLIWNVLAWVARRVLVGKTKGIRLTGIPVVAFVLFKLSLLSAIGILLVIWLASAVAKWSLATVLIKAALMLLVLNMIVGIAGGAAINSILAIRRARSRVVA